VWGSDPHTSDSSLEAACVHAGLLKPGETGVVKVTMVPPVPVFHESTQNGVTTLLWDTSFPGAYQVERFKN
jgi:hypothetical protein